MTNNECRVVALMGSYRQGGTLDTAVGEVLAGARKQGAEVRKIDLVDRHVEFCTNCRECCQQPGERRGRCVQDDELNEILDTLEDADAIVLGAPVNFGDVNALTRRFLERMVGYAYWPWGRPAPKPRRQRADKPAVLVTSSAAPGFLTRWFARPLKTLRQMARMLGARPVGSFVAGLAGSPEVQLSEPRREAARRLGRELVARARNG